VFQCLRNEDNTAHTEYKGYELEIGRKTWVTLEMWDWASGERARCLAQQKPSARLWVSHVAEGRRRRSTSPERANLAVLPL